ncbi:MAG: NAD(+) synthase [Oscillospiraceae bacterium]|nr:NAD(+) synthase [Oscillospiraceae bacterium]
MKDGFLKVASASPDVRVADCEYNTDKIIECIEKAERRRIRLLALPELAITAYSCGDLFLQPTLLEAAKRALLRVTDATKGKNLIAVVGLPVAVNGLLYNAAAVVCGGAILGVVPKSFIPNYSEFYEGRYFSEAPQENTEIPVGGHLVPFGAKQIFRCREMPDFQLAVEICEDLFTAASPCVWHTKAGATVVVNPSASDEVVTKADFRRKLVSIQSTKMGCAYVYCSAGPGESTEDVVFSAHDMIAENGAILAESAPFGEGWCETEVDVQRLMNERLRTTSVRDGDPPKGYLYTDFSLRAEQTALTRRVDAHPFVPSDDAVRAVRCEDIFNIQCAGLAKRVEHTRCAAAVIGVSGGLDSTLALLVACRAYKKLGRAPSGIIAVSMPCFGTTRRTKSNAHKLCEALGVTFRETDIGEAVRVHLRDVGHDGSTPDVTFENAQARERTQLLMDIANRENGLVIGTGDLSELALGWCTYNGDHMSMYAVNCSVPKTLVRYLVRYVADGDAALHDVLYDILDTPVSPELIPSDGKEMPQRTEDIIGPYELHDFFLYYFVRWSFSPEKILRLAAYAFDGVYDKATIEKWLRLFYKRFFAQQFKRSCVPGGPKVGSVALSPRGDWRMPADAVGALWLSALE